MKKKENNFFCHESSYIDENVSIGNDTKIWHFSHIQAGAIIGSNCTLGQNVNVSNNVKIGSFVKIQNNVSIYEGVELSDYVFCGPSMVFTNIKLPRSEFPQKGGKYYLKTFVGKSVSIEQMLPYLWCNNWRYSVIGAGTVVTPKCATIFFSDWGSRKLIGKVTRKVKL